MNRALYLMLWVFEVLALVGLVLVLALPIQDYAQFFHWLIIAVPLGATAALLTGPLTRYRRKLW
jgi:hypothetical protein